MGPSTKNTPISIYTDHSKGKPYRTMRRIDRRKRLMKYYSIAWTWLYGALCVLNLWHWMTISMMSWALKMMSSTLNYSFRRGCSAATQANFNWWCRSRKNPKHMWVELTLKRTCGRNIMTNYTIYIYGIIYGRLNVENIMHNIVNPT